MKKILAIVFFFISVNLYGQIAQTDTVKIEDDIYYAYKNSMRGVIWAIDNVPFKKEVTYKDLIIDNRKICSLKIYNQEGGIKIVSTGYYNSTTVEITTYKSLPERNR
jgi:hypothetical protein